MSKRNIQWDYDAWQDYLYWQTQDKIMVKDTERNGLQNGTGNPEPLKFRKAWSRRIDHADRLVYNIDENGNLNAPSSMRNFFASDL